MMILGISSLSHDASISLIDNDTVLFASHSERFSRIKNDPYLNKELLDYCLNYGYPKYLTFYENIKLKKLRYLYSGQYEHLFEHNIKSYLKHNFNEFKFHELPIKIVSHHHSHAAAGYYTSKFTEATIVICDALGEFNTITIWRANGRNLKKLWSENYPNSLGLFYSAFTQRCGFKPNEEEYILMGLSAFGEPKYYDLICRDFNINPNNPKFNSNTNFHRGCKNWRMDLTDHENIASSVQKITEDYLINLIKHSKKLNNSKNLVLGGGVFLNCVANSKILESNIYKNIWIFPNPGDAGSSLGSALAAKNEWIDWKTPYLGYDIKRPYQYDDIINELITGNIVGLANGRAEFGPRALGNRSLLADPRISNIQELMNVVKKREKFRPFAPVILEEKASEFFDISTTSPYMQYVAKCKYPMQYPGICHVDNTSRLQTINSTQNLKFYRLLKMFYEKTGCPMLINTSLNIKGQPLVNTWHDAIDFSKKYNVKVF